jgi:hypothetical protein
MEFYYVLSEDERTATCYYDDQREERGGILPGCNTVYSSRLFGELMIKKVVFDVTCKSASFDSTWNWFYGCSSLEEITGLEHLNTGRVKNMSSMFSYCTALSALDLSSFDTTRVENMSSMFFGCSALTHLDLSTFNTARVGSMCSMFQGCRSLKALDLSSFNGSAVEDLQNMFADCTALTHLDLSYFYPKKVKVLRDVFFNCRELTTIYCKTTWSCGESDGMFEDCRKLRGAVPYDLTRTDVEMANFKTGYFSSEEPNLPVPEKKSETAPEKKEEPANNEEHMTPNEFVNCSFFTMQGVPLEGGVADLPAGMYLMKKD